MPYANEICGIYRIVNKTTNECYVGQSQYMQKRIKEHFRLLRLNRHPNPRLQNSYNKYGKESFFGEPEVIMENLDELDMLEEIFINGHADFETPVVFNIANFAKAPMRGKSHTEETRSKISKSKKNSKFDTSSPEWRMSLKAGQLRRVLQDRNLCSEIRFILENEHLTYAERGRAIGKDTGSVRKLYLRYKDKKELFL